MMMADRNLNCQTLFLITPRLERMDPWLQAHYSWGQPNRLLQLGGPSVTKEPEL